MAEVRRSMMSSQILPKLSGAQTSGSSMERSSRDGSTNV